MTETGSNRASLGPDAARALESARRCLREGRPRRARRHCRRVLAGAPEHAEALHLSGVAALRAGDLGEAITMLRSQGYQHGHIHPTAWLSGVYYARLPDGCGGDGHAGGIEFGRSPGHYPDGDQGEVRVLQPEEGTIVLFPSFLYHRTLPFVADETRVTIAFDFRPPGDHAN